MRQKEKENILENVSILLAWYYSEFRNKFIAFTPILGQENCQLMTCFIIYRFYFIYMYIFSDIR